MTSGKRTRALRQAEAQRHSEALKALEGRRRLHLDKPATSAITSIGSPLVLLLALMEVTIGVMVLRGIK